MWICKRNLVGPLLLSLLAIAPAGAQPVPVRFPEGTAHAYLSLSNEDGKILAAGECTQTIRNGVVTQRTVFHFRDGSLDDETAVFSQHGVFRLLRDHHLQRGPSFALPSDLSFDTRTGAVSVTYPGDTKDKPFQGHMDLPSDLSNGVIFDLFKDIPQDRPLTQLTYLVVSPKPRVVNLEITPEADAVFESTGARIKARHLRIHLKVEGMAGLVAPLVGKQPEDLHVWDSRDPVPAFLQLTGQLYNGGPLWTIAMSAPRILPPR